MGHMTHVFRFGAKATRAASATEWADLAKQAEDLGYASFQIDDHFDNQLAPVPAIMAAAAATSRILVGPHVAGIAGAFGLPPEVVATAPFFQIGSLQQITENIQAMRERWGISYIVCQNDGTEALAPIVAKLAGT